MQRGSAGQEELEAAVDRLSLPDLEARVLIELGRRATPLIPGEVPAFLAATLQESKEDCFRAFLELQRRDLIEVDAALGRVDVAYDTLGVPSSLKQQLRAIPSTYEDVGLPESRQAVEGLRTIFGESDHVFVAAEYAGHALYPDLETRASRALQTTFLFPRRSQVSADRQHAYDQALKDWDDLFELKPSLRKHVQIRLVRTRPRSIYYAVLSRDRARFNLWLYSGDPRHGHIVEAKSGSSLYETAETDFRVALARAVPRWKWWKLAWLATTVKPWAPSIVGLAIAAGLTVLGGGAALFAAGIVASIATKALYDTWRQRPPSPPALYNR